MRRRVGISRTPVRERVTTTKRVKAFLPTRTASGRAAVGCALWEVYVRGAALG